MAQNTTITVPAQTWTLLTDANVTNITFQNVGNYSCVVQATTGPAPNSTAGSIEYDAKQGERNVLLADLFPGVAGADRLWAYSESGTSVVTSHA